MSRYKDITKSACALLKDIPVVNQEIADALTERQLAVSRVEATERRDLWAGLTILEADILAALMGAALHVFVLLARRRRAVEQLMRERLLPLITSRYSRFAARVTAMLVRLARQEALLVRDVVNEAAQTRIIDSLPSLATLRQVVMETLMPTATTPTDLSATGETWWERQGVNLGQRLHDQLLVSVSLAESLPRMQARVLGTRPQGFQDGIMARARQDAARLLATQVTSAVSQARVAVADANAGQLITIHNSILDSKISRICLGRHGLKFTVPGHEPLGHDIPYLGGPPYHPNCRSEMIPGLEGGGPVAQEDLGVWLRRKGPAFQDTVLGPKRAQMFRTGKLTSLHDLLEASSGRPLTLQELGA